MNYQINYQIAVSILSILMGVLLYAFRNTPNPYIGIRIGYTYLSKEAWRRANTFAGIYCMVSGFVLLAVSLIFHPSRSVFLAIILILAAVLAVQSYRIAKETYKREGLKTHVSAARLKKMEAKSTDVKLYLLVQLIPVVVYLILALALWNKLPDTVAIHFSASGRPNGYASKLSGALAIPLIVMAIVPVITAVSLKEPMLVRYPKGGQKAIFKVLTGVQFIVATAVTLALLYNAGMISGNSIVLLATCSILLLIVWIARIWRCEVSA
ncbi:DUF1648 domain-containing protein [Desulfurobacterium sp.]